LESWNAGVIMKEVLSIFQQSNTPLIHCSSGILSQNINPSKIPFTFLIILKKLFIGERIIAVNENTNILPPEPSYGKTIKIGSVVVVPPNASHTSKCIKSGLVLDVFHPVRKDYRQ
jgi:hypothetical protein